MIVRNVTDKDLENIRYLSSLQKDFKLDCLDGAIIQKIVFDNNKLIAYGIVKKLAEAIMLVDPSAPKLTRAKAMRELMQFAEFGSKREGCEQLHCFISDPFLAESLEDHFGFIKSKDIVMAKNI